MDELFSVRALLVADATNEHDLFRKAAQAAKVPIEVVVALNSGGAGRSIAAGVDLVLIDATLGEAAVAEIIAAARAAPKPPFTVLLTAEANNPVFATDALASRPWELFETKRLLELSSQVRRTLRVLVLDDSATMRSIIRKTLAAARLPLEVSEADQGGAAIELAAEVDFDLVFCDYNLPGFNGLETMAEIRRLKREPTFVLMTSDTDSAIAARARSSGAFFLKKPFFTADIEALFCRFYGLRALNPKRS